MTKSKFVIIYINAQRWKKKKKKKKADKKELEKKSKTSSLIFIYL